jgi:hypothetical protein
MTGLYTLAAAAVVGTGTGIYEATQAGKISGQAMGQSGTIFGEQQNYQALLAQLIANPSLVSSLPGYQFQFGQGIQAIQRANPGATGQELTAATQFGQGLAGSFYTTQANLLAELSGITAPSSTAQLGSVATGARSSQASQINNLLAELGIGTGMYFGGGLPGSYAPGGNAYTGVLSGANPGGGYTYS